MWCIGVATGVVADDDVDDCCSAVVESGLGGEVGDHVENDLLIFTQVPAMEFFKALGWDEVDNGNEED